MEYSGDETALTGTAFGVKLLAGVIGLCAFALAGFGILSVADLRLSSTNLPSLVVTALLLGFGLGMLVLAAGLWRGLYWAWSWGIIIYIGSTFGGLAAGVTTGDLSALGSSAVSVLIACYLYRHRSEFEKT